MEETNTTRSNRSLDDIIIEIHQKQQSWTNTSTIFRVPPNLREVDRDAFTPKVVSLGPYHRNNPSLKEMEERKPHYLYSFLNDMTILQHCPDPKVKLEHCMTRMMEVESKARNCYSGRINMDRDVFAEMLLLDGCFTLKVLLDRPAATDTPSMYLLVTLDMLMLENQIPFFVLEKLYELVSDADGEGTSLQTHVLKFVQDFFPDDYDPPSNPPNSEPCHLLHQIHSWMVPKHAQKKDDRNQEVNEREMDVVPEAIPSAMELKEAGVELRWKRKGAALEVTFEKGVLEMSQLKIYDHFRFFLRNLIALEHCYLPCGRYVTDYVFFVDRLVNTPRDVALLQGKGLLVNGLGSEEEVAQLINGLSKNMIWDSRNNKLKGVFRGINEHCRFKWWRWRAKLMRDSFGSPWSIIALLGASAVLVLAFTQTVYTALSYYKS